jgi:hypothetical protein
MSENPSRPVQSNFANFNEYSIAFKRWLGWASYKVRSEKIERRFYAHQRMGRGRNIAIPTEKAIIVQNMEFQKAQNEFLTTGSINKAKVCKTTTCLPARIMLEEFMRDTNQTDHFEMTKKVLVSLEKYLFTRKIQPPRPSTMMIIAYYVANCDLRPSQIADITNTNIHSINMNIKQLGLNSRNQLRDILSLPLCTKSNIPSIEHHYISMRIRKQTQLEQKQAKEEVERKKAIEFWHKKEAAENKNLKILWSQQKEAKRKEKIHKNIQKWLERK